MTTDEKSKIMIEYQKEIENLNLLKKYIQNINNCEWNDLFFLTDKKEVMKDIQNKIDNILNNFLAND